MTISNLNFFTPSMFAQRTQKQSIPSNANLSTDSAEIASPETELLQTPAHTESTLQTLNASQNTHSSNARDADDKIIAAWFKLMKPNAGTSSDSLQNERKEDDPGRVPDPLYEPTKATVPDSLKIITFNDLMRAFAPKKPHWKHYDDTSNQFQVGSQERD